MYRMAPDRTAAAELYAFLTMALSPQSVQYFAPHLLIFLLENKVYQRSAIYAVLRVVGNPTLDYSIASEYAPFAILFS